jgi:malate synthase
MLSEELQKLRRGAAADGRWDDAAALFRDLMEAESFPEFLTLPAYDMITASGE